ncbi:hypothetical protein V1512DRAFT_266504 [Lipomyces arxii]|uniref:uncharacterized protein n=1 Tax=Lipomyces arxii TaxID=56418 RepID=UPI0034CD1DA6
MTEVAPTQDPSSQGNPYSFDPVAEYQKLLDLRAKVQAGVYPQFSIRSRQPEERGSPRSTNQAPAAYDERDYRQKQEADGYRPYPPGPPRDGYEELKRKREWESHAQVEDERLKRRHQSPGYTLPYGETGRPLSYASADQPPPPVPSAGPRHDDYGRPIQADPYATHVPPPAQQYGRPPAHQPYYDAAPQNRSGPHGPTVQMTTAVLPAGVIVEEGFTRDAQRGYELYIPSAAKKGRYLSTSFNPAPSAPSGPPHAPVSAPAYGSYNAPYGAMRGPPPVAPPVISHWPPYPSESSSDQLV